MIQSDLYDGIQDLLSFISQAKEICDAFPDLQNTPTPRLGLNFFIGASIETKTNLLKELEILEATTQKLVQRVKLPVLIGVIGKYSSGKSSLLNCFFDHIFQGQVPKHVLRETGNTVIDLKFTYVTHSDFADAFKNTEDIKVVSVDHELFRTFNFIDTPGTGWNSFTKKEVCDLLSASDIMLFLSKPTEILEALSVEALYVKFTIYKDIPMWYVITHASDYAHHGDWENIRTDEFKQDLIAAKTKLAERKYVNEADMQARDLVALNVQFAVDENTFLIDAKYKFGIDDLLSRIHEAFGSPAAKRDKLRQLRTDIRATYDRLNEVLTVAENFINKLADVLSNACSTSVKSDVARLCATTIPSEAALLSQAMYAKLRQDPIRYEAYMVGESSVIPAIYGYEAVEVVILRSQLDEIRQEKSSARYEALRPDFLFTVKNIETKMERQWIAIGMNLRKEMDAMWSQALPKLLSGKLGANLPLNTEQTRQMIAADCKEIVQSVKEDSKHRKGAVNDAFRKPVLKLIRLYFDDDPSKSIFNRQDTLLKKMKLDIPAMCDETRSEIRGMSLKAVNYAESCTKQFQDLIDTRIRNLSKTTSSHIAEHVFLPTKESLDFLFGGHEVLFHPETVDFGAEDQMYSRFRIDSALTDITSEVDRYEELSISEIHKLQSGWEKEWEALDTEYKVLVADAQSVSAELKGFLKSLATILDKQTRGGNLLVTNHLDGLRVKLEKLFDQNSDLFQSARIEAKKRGRTRKLVEVVALILSIALPALKLWQYLTPPPVPNSIQTAELSDPRTGVPTPGLTSSMSPLQGQAGHDRPTPTLTPPTPIQPRDRMTSSSTSGDLLVTGAVTIIGLSVAAWMFSRMLAHRSIFDRLIEQIYKERRDRFLSQVEEQIRIVLGKLAEGLNEVNDNAKAELVTLYDAVIERCEKANNNLIPGINGQIEAGAKLAVSTTKQVGKAQGVSSARIVDCVNTRLNRVSEEMDEEVKSAFVEVIDKTTAQYINKLDGYIDLYRELVKNAARLRSKVATRVAKI